MRIKNLSWIQIRLLLRRFSKLLKFRNLNKILEEYLIKSYQLHNDLELITNHLPEDNLRKIVYSNQLQRDNFL